MTSPTGVIKIDAAALSGVGNRVAQLTASTMHSVYAHLGGAPEVQREYDAFVHRWDERRDALFRALGEVADMARTIANEFERVDADLANQLGQPADSGGTDGMRM